MPRGESRDQLELQLALKREHVFTQEWLLAQRQRPDQGFGLAEDQGDVNEKITTQIKKFQYFYPYTVALVGTQAGSQVNFMSCAWHTALSFEPPLFGVLISKKRFTHGLISGAREFTRELPGLRRQSSWRPKWDAISAYRDGQSQGIPSETRVGENPPVPIRRRSLCRVRMPASRCPALRRP